MSRGDSIKGILEKGEQYDQSIFGKINPRQALVVVYVVKLLKKDWKNIQKVFSGITKIAIKSTFAGALMDDLENKAPIGIREVALDEAKTKIEELFFK